MKCFVGFLASGALLAWLFMGCDHHGGGASGKPAGKRQIAVIPKGLTHNHWQGVKAGAEKAAAEAGNVEVIWKGPPKEDDTKQQIELVQNFVSGGIDGIVLAPLSDQALLSPVRLAAKAGIPVVIIDSALAGEVGKDYIGYIGTDNEMAGRLAGRRLAQLMGGRGTALLLRYYESSASTNERERGFIAALNEAAPEIKLIDPPQYAGADVNSAKRSAENMLTAHAGRFEGLFCPNESSTFGMLLALRDRRLAGQVKFVGFDHRPELIAAMKTGEIHGLVIQNPVRMGYLGVRALAAHFQGKKVDTKVDTGAILVTPENVDDPQIRQLLNPLSGG